MDNKFVILIEVVLISAPNLLKQEQNITYRTKSVIELENKQEKVLETNWTKVLSMVL